MLFETDYEDVYTETQKALIGDEFSRLKGHCYVEHAGATLYSTRQLKDVFDELQENIFSNPHAHNISSKVTEDAVDQVRFLVLEHFNTTPEEYSIIFTSGATASLKMVGEMFVYAPEICVDKSERGTLVYTEDNHTSVLGMREYTQNLKVLTQETLFDVFTGPIEQYDEEITTSSLFAYPAESNFSGRKYPLEWIEEVHNGRLNKLLGKPSNWFCLLDAACFVSTNRLDLSKHKPDFVCLSFYKVFGYPTGLGALLVKNSSSHVLNKLYFGGGTVQMTLSSEKFHVPRPVLHDRFEDGSLPFLSIIAVRQGFRTLKRLSINMDLISEHTFNLARYVHHVLLSLHHSNGAPVAVLYHDTDFEDISQQGGIVNFNLLRNNGEYIGYSEVLHMANLYKIHLRTGCFCNTGACRYHLKLTNDVIRHHFQSGHVCGDENDLVDNYPTGSVRVSFGYMSTKQEADLVLSMIADCYVNKPIVWKSLQINQRNKNKTSNGLNVNKKAKVSNGTTTQVKLGSEKQKNGVTNGVSTTTGKPNSGILQDIYLYPVKSCGAYAVKHSWQLGPKGLLYDREWMILMPSGVCMTQKQEVRLCLIKPIVDLDGGTLQLNFPGMPALTLPLRPSLGTKQEADLCSSKVCGDRVQGWDCGDEAAQWLYDALGHYGLRLFHQCEDEGRFAKNVSKSDTDKTLLTLTNQAQFLLINTASIQWLADLVPEDTLNVDVTNLTHRFRANFIVKCPNAFQEISCSSVKIGNFIFESGGPCSRCQMICIDQATGEKTAEPLRTLSAKSGGKIKFGTYLKQLASDFPYTLYLGEVVEFFS